MSRWFRVYDDLVDDPKVQRLPADLFKALINLWCLASRNRGELPSVECISFSLRMRTERAVRVLIDLRDAGLIDCDDTGRRPHNWSGRQFKSDVTDPTNAERQKRFRNAKRNGDRNGDDNTTSNDQRQSTDTESEQIPSLRSGTRGALAPGWPADYGERFWEAFPNKVGKQDALRKLERLAKSGEVGFDELMAALRRYAAKTDDRPFCNPATWINQGRWTDVPAQNVNGKRTIQQAAADQLDVFRSITEPRQVRDGEGEPPVRLLPPR